MGEKENMQTDYQTLWNKCLAVIKDIVPKAAFDTWFVPIVPLSYEDKKFTIQVPSQFFYEYLEEKYVNVLKVTLYRVIGQGTILNYRIMVDKTTGGTVDYPAENASTAVKKVTPKDANKAPNPFMTTAPQDLDPQLNPKYNFDNYFEGTSNKLVRTAGEAVAQNPGKTTFNPLFIFGPSGVGKTHLCHAIGTRIRELHPEKKVLYVSSHLFRVQFTDAIRKNTTNDFLNFYQNIDVLLLDDIQELIGMDKTQNTFFHIFNHLHLSNKQLILTSDKPPVELKDIEQRLITRFKWGLSTQLLQPDYETKVKIIRNKAVKLNAEVPQEVVEFLAENINANVREIEGALSSLVANASFLGKKISITLAREILKVYVQFNQREITIEHIRKVVCEYMGLSAEVFNSPKRTREIAQARQIAMYLSKQHTKAPLTTIGAAIGGKNHATVLHACKAISNLMETDKVFCHQVEEIEKKVLARS